MAGPAVPVSLLLDAGSALLAAMAGVRDGAEAAGLSISAYVMRTLLERMERARFEKQCGPDVWRAMVDEIVGWIDLDAVPE